MQRPTPTSRYRSWPFCALLAFIALSCLTACATARSALPQTPSAVEQQTVYLTPFVTTLVPEEFGTPAFDEFVDKLNAARAGGAQQFVILKEDLPAIDAAWLLRQYYVSGEIYSYVENHGCCQSELRVKARLELHEPGQPDPAATVTIPMDSFFDHDRGTLEQERLKLAKRLADELARQLARILAASR